MTVQQVASSTSYLLIIDADPVHAQSLARQLVKHGYHVNVAANGSTAVDLVDSSLPDLILLHVTMLDLDGDEVCQALKTDERTRSIPVIFLSGLAVAADRIKTFAVSGIDVITQPFQFQTLLERIEHQLQPLRLQKERQQQQQLLMEQQPPFQSAIGQPAVDQRDRSLQKGEQSEVEALAHAQNDVPNFQQQYRGHLWQYRDLAARKVVETELRRKTKALTDFSASLKQLHRLNMTDFESLESLFADYIQTGCTVLGFTAGAIGRVQGQTYTFLAVQSEFESLVPNLTIDLQEAYCGKVSACQATVSFDHVGQMEDMRCHPLYQALKLESYLGTPIFVDEAMFGTLCFFSTHVRPQGFESHEQEIIELMAQSIGKFISTQQIEAKQRQAEKEVRLLLALTQEIAAASDFDQALEIALRTLCEATDWIYGEAWLPSADGTVLECSPIWHCNRNHKTPQAIALVEQFRQTIAKTTLQLGEGSAGRIWQSQHAEWMPDVEAFLKHAPASTHFSKQRLSSKTFGLNVHFGVPIMVAGDSTKLKHPDAFQASIEPSQPAVLAVLVFFIAKSSPQDERLTQLVAAVAAQLGIILAQKQAEAELQALFRAMTDSVVVRDAKGRCLKIASSSPNLIKPVDEMIGKTLHETLPEPIAALILDGIQTSLTTNQTVELEYSLSIHKQEVWLSARISPLSEKAVILVARDITKRKRVERALQQSEAHNRAFLNAIPDLLLRVNNAGYHLDYIPPKNFKDVFRSSNRLDKSIFETLPPALAQLQMRSIQTALITGETQVYEHRFEASGRIIDEEVRISVSGEDEVLMVIRDVTQRKQTENALRESEERFRAIFEQAAVGIALTTTSGQIIRVNKGVCDLLGYTESELVSLTSQEITYSEDLEQSLVNTRRALAGETQTFSLEKRYVCKNGLWRWVNLTASLMCNAIGVPQYFISVIEDIQERKEAEEALREAKEAALREAARSADANRTKSEFLANMSHELRTPLNAILGFAQLMAREPSLNQTAHEYLEIIGRSGEHLLNLINDVLEMSKIEAGQISLHSQAFDLYNLLQNLEEMLQLKAGSKELQLSFNCDPAVPQYIQTDEGKLRQVLINLLGNAIKFTREGRVALHIRLWERGQGTGAREAGEAREIGGVGEVKGDRALFAASLASHTPRPTPHTLVSASHTSHLTPHTLVFEVEDTGPGIAPHELESLFEPFVQSRSGQSHEGTGLGLPISQKFVQLMGGEITVNSVLNQGTSVQFDVQVHLAQAYDVRTRQPKRSAIALAPAHAPVRILVVEDHPESRQLLVHMLRSRGFEIQEADNGEAALTLWQTWQPDLIWMDMRMPVMDGFETTQRIRSVTALQAASLRTPVIIALTASAFEEERAKVLAAGCDDFVRKPFREDTILAKIAEHLGVKYVYKDNKGRDRVMRNEFDEGLNGPASPSSNPPGKITPLTALPSNSKLEPSALSIMPTEWIQQVHRAAVLGSDRQLLQLIEAIPETHTSLANTLANWIRNFQFDRLLTLTQPHCR